MSRGPLHYMVAGPRVIRDPHAAKRSLNLFQVEGLPETSPTFARREDAERWMAEQVQKRSASRTPRERASMTCGQNFLSAGIHNRMCDPCRRRAQDIDGVVNMVVRGQRKVR